MNIYLKNFIKMNASEEILFLIQGNTMIQTIRKPLPNYLDLPLCQG